METDKPNNINADIETLSSQDALRDKLKEIEKKYEELKHTFMHFFSTIF